LRDGSCQIIRNFYENNPKHPLKIIDLINNNITERGVDILNEISVLVSSDDNKDEDNDNDELAFIVGSFYSNDISKWNMTIKTDDNYLYNRENMKFNTDLNALNDDDNNLIQSDDDDKH